jgi:hypothetical protein
MRLWVTALVFIGVGLWLAWLGAAQLADAWPRSTRTVGGSVSDVETRAFGGGAGRLVFRLEGRAQRLELTSPSLPYPTAGQLADSGRVTIDYDTSVRIRTNDRSDTQYVPVYVVTGLAVDGRVYFTTGMYRLMVVFWALVLSVPGGMALGLGAVWIYRLSRNPQWRPLPWRWRGNYARALVFAAPAARDPRKTADGHWLH